MPNTAITASPMNFSTVPPWRSTTAFIASKYPVITRRRASGSMRSPRAVDPATSQNRMVTVLRTSRGAASAKDDPQARQNRALAGFSVPQLAQVGTFENIGLETTRGTVPSGDDPPPARPEGLLSGSSHLPGVGGLHGSG